MTAATGTAPTEVAAWMDAAVAGDRAAFGRLYERYRVVVHRFVKARVGSPQIAEDLTADTFTKALARIHTFTWQGRDPGAWFITIARNLVADHYKAGARREYAFDMAPPADSAEADWWIEIADTDTATQPEDAAMRHLDATDAMYAITALSPDQRACLVHRFLYGHSVAETAQALSRHEGAVKGLQSRAVRSAHRALLERERRWATQHAPTPTAAPPPVPAPPPAQEQTPVIPQPREPEDRFVVDEPIEPRIMWRCRDCGGTDAKAYLTHGAPNRCQGWLEPIEVNR